MYTPHPALKGVKKLVDK